MIAGALCDISHTFSILVSSDLQELNTEVFDDTRGTA